MLKGPKINVCRREVLTGLKIAYKKENYPSGNKYVEDNKKCLNLENNCIIIICVPF